VVIAYPAPRMMRICPTFVRNVELDVHFAEMRT